MSRQTITPLSMSQTKEELLRHLDMPTEIYDIMAAETAKCYSWLTSSSEYFKPLGNQVAPFDWSDITELAKSEAAAWLSEPSDKVTSTYWQMGVTPSNENNWVAIWFLYHKFRYRDGRNRSKDSKKGTKKHCKSVSGVKKPLTKRTSSHPGSSDRSSPSARSLEYSPQPMYYELPNAPSSAIMFIPSPNQPVNISSAPVITSTPLFDPVRNVWVNPQ